MKPGVFLLFLIVIYIDNFNCVAQTGPAGVGSSVNNVLWLKADAGTSSSIDSAAINLWSDQSGNNINVSQSTAIQRPRYRSSIMNGFPSIEFDNVNTAGQNDYLIAPDNALLDNTNGYSFFTVTRMKNLDGSLARCIVSKRNTIDIDEAFMLFYWTSNYCYLDIDGLGNRFNTGSVTYSNNNNYIIDAFYDGTLPAASRSKIYEGETLRKTGSESSSFVPDKPSPLLIGATHSADNRAFAGFISEVIIFRTNLNNASRIIINNYLSAKYNISLAANDYYAGDNGINGNYDFDVAGLGQDSSGNTTSFESSICAGLKIANNSGLNNNDYIFAGHACKVNSLNTYDIGGLTGPDRARLDRIWYIDITNTGATLNNTIEFDLGDAGMGIVTAGTPGDYSLLYRTGQSGNWTVLSTATSVSGDRVIFNSINLTSDGYYTLGSGNLSTGPLPVSLISFDAIPKENQVDLNWKTASEINCDYFTIEKSKNGTDFTFLLNKNGAGTSSVVNSYDDVDLNPYPGDSYYRLKQTDFNGTETHFKLAKVHFKGSSNSNVNLVNNFTETDGLFYLEVESASEATLNIQLVDLYGRICKSQEIQIASGKSTAEFKIENISTGTYVINMVFDDIKDSKLVFVK